jgi:hypothetical protein
MDIRSFAALKKTSGASRRQRSHRELLHVATATERLRDGLRQQGFFAANVYESRRNVYPQDELPPQRKDELHGAKEVITDALFRA